MLWTLAVLAVPAGQVAGADPEPEAGEWKQLEPIPPRLPRVTDKFGCRWGLTAAGDIGLSNVATGQIGAFESGATLLIADKPVEFKSLQWIEDVPIYRFSGTVGTVTVTRDVWIDRERGGARFIDRFSTVETSPQKLSIAIRTTFGDGVETVGNLAGTAFVGPSLGKGDSGLVVTQEPQSGKAAVIFLLADAARSKTLPTVVRNNNNEVFTAQWTVEVTADRPAGLLHWLIQRPTLTPDQAAKATEPFLRPNGRLVRPRVEAGLAASIANFGIAASSDAVAGGNAAESVLRPLQRFCTQLGIDRGAEDVYWINASSNLTGRIEGGAATVATRFGAVTLSLAEIAAIQGGGGKGRVPRVFLRDGTVLSGPLTLPDWKLLGAKGWTISLMPEALEAVVLHATPADGKSGEPGLAMAALISGEVLPVVPAAAQKLGLSTPWGGLDVPLEQVLALHRLRRPAPMALVSLADGSRLRVFPADAPVSVRSPRFGPQSLRAAELNAWWLPGSDDGAEPSEEPDEDPASLDPLEGSFALLKGGTILAGRPSGDSLTIAAGGTETKVQISELAGLKRLDSATDTAPQFHFDMSAGGNGLDGFLADASVIFETSSGPREIPVAHLIALKLGTPGR